MSSRDQLKARGKATMMRRHIKSLQKNRKRKNGDDDSSSDDGNDNTAGILPKPSQLLRKSKDKDNSGSKDKPVHREKLVNKLAVPDFSNVLPFTKCFWTGEPGQETPSEELKQKRKNIGVLVKGSLHLCPPPINNISDVGIPAEFGRLFSSQQISKPTPVQMQCWPIILSGANILGISSTGSGKTFAFGFPMIPHIVKQLPAFRSKKIKRPSPIALVLVPTRELAIQVNQSFRPFKRLCEIQSSAVYGGQVRDKETGELAGCSSSTHIVVATPGRLLDMLSTKHLSLANVTYLVLDEADRMLAAGFFEQLDAISNQIRPDRQALLFSATFPEKLREAAKKWVGDAVTVRCSTVDMLDKSANCTSSAETPVTNKDNNDGGDDEDDNHVQKSARVAPRDEQSVTECVQDDDDNVDQAESGVTAEQLPAVPEGEEMPSSKPELTRGQQHHSSATSLTISANINQAVHVCVPHKKPRLLIRYILRVREQEKTDKLRQPGPMLIFCTKIKTLKFVVEFMKRNNVPHAEMLHGQLPQDQRERILANFRAGKTHTLCATDVMARGINIKRLKYVINYDFPSTLEQYCHRVGRTGRSEGEIGYSYSFLTRNMAPMAKDVLTLLRSSQQVPEPNLVALAEEYESGQFVFDTNEDDGSGAHGTDDNDDA